MTIALRALPEQKEEWLMKQMPEGITLLWVEDSIPEADVYFDLAYASLPFSFTNIAGKPVFVNAVIETLAELPANVSRINAWPGFLKREISEVVCRNDAARQVLQAMQWKIAEVPDIPGMIAPRTISMIINEAYFALGDEVSTKDEIDTAMKLGTNYPYGPFEWSRIIGLHHVYRLLKTLSKTDDRYQTAPALEQELKSVA